MDRRKGDGEWMDRIKDVGEWIDRIKGVREWMDRRKVTEKTVLGRHFQPLTRATRKGDNAHLAVSHVQAVAEKGKKTCMHPPDCTH